MKKINKNSIATVLAVSIALGLGGPLAVFAATTPSLGSAATYGVLGSTYSSTAAGTTVSGDVGFTTGPAVAPAGVHTNYGSGAPYSTAGIDQGSALSTLAAQPCTFTFPLGPTDLATDATHGPIGVYAPGVYCTSGAGAASIGTGGITLSGSGTFIFRVNGALTAVANSVVSLAGGASACDVFWTPTQATTLGANSTFVGTNIDDSGITMGSTVAWTGRALAFGGTVSTDADTITVPTCTASIPPPVVVVPPPAPVVPPPAPVVVPPPVVVVPPPAPVFVPAPVVVPTLPNSGIGPNDNSSIPWNITVPAGILVALLSLYVFKKKRTI